jgi:hypothetical protein
MLQFLRYALTNLFLAIEVGASISPLVMRPVMIHEYGALAEWYLPRENRNAQTKGKKILPQRQFIYHKSSGLHRE